MTSVRTVILVLVAAVLLPACSTLKPVEMPAEDVQRMILSGEIPLAGESIKVVTRDGKTHKYRVVDVDVDSRLIRGREDTVAIDDVVAIETKKFSVGKTALVAGSSYLLLGLLALAAAPAFLL